MAEAIGKETIASQYSPDLTKHWIYGDKKKNPLLKKIVESASFHFLSESGKCTPISPSAKAPSIASVNA